MNNHKSATATFVILFGVTLLYVVAATIGLTYAVVGNAISLVWAPSGIALAALLAFGYRVIFAVALGAFLANFWTGMPLGVAAAIATGNASEALVGAFLLLRLAHFHSALERRRDVLALIILAAIFSTMVSASLGVGALVLGGIVSLNEYATAWTKWWLGDMMGVLVVTPALLVWLSRTQTALSRLKVVEVFFMMAALLAVSHEIFGSPELAMQGFYLASLAVFPFVIWAALRFGQRGVTLVTLVVSLMAIWGTINGTGPFVVGEPMDNMVRWCAFAIVVAATGLLLAASVAEQQHTQEQLRQSHDELEQRVVERTRALALSNADLQREMNERRHLEAQLISASEEHQQAIGRELHDGLGQHLVSLALLGATLQQQLAKRAQPEADAARRIVELANHANTLAQSIARGLYPAELALGGLPAALATLTEQTQSLQTMSCAFHADHGLQVHHPLVAINLYRIAQEAINNAVKYSQARALHIELTRIEGGCRLCISDDGIGMELAPSRRDKGVGMRNMHYRASLLGGTFEISKNYPSGTRIAVTYPDQEPS